MCFRPATTRRQARPSTSFVDNAIDLPAKYSEFRVWGKVPEGSTLIFEDIQISLRYSVGQMQKEASVHSSTRLAILVELLADRHRHRAIAYTALA